MQLSSSPLVVLAAVLGVVRSVVIPLDNNNVDQVLKTSEVVFVNFYADWCRFSQMLKPIFLEASDKFKDVPASKITFASVDCDRQPEIAAKYHVNKYPTLKLIRNGELAKKEYRSQRSVEALSAFVQKQLDTGITPYTNEADIQIDEKKRNVIAAFPAESGPAFDNFKKAASLLREECVFYQGQAAAPSIKFRGGNKPAEPFTADLNNFDALKQWLQERCVPIVREITFENAEELTEEGLPFVILFKAPDDTKSQEVFTESVIREIADQKTAVNCLVADGLKFAHPLHHLGKSAQDLPVIAIDSFRHMYIFPDMKKLTTPGALRQFVLDLHSGKLHREFHHGPDQPNSPPADTQPPPSVFEKLKPAENRYTIVNKDEL